MKCLALELGEHGIRLNSVNPTSVSTPMLINDPTFKLFLPDSANPTVDEFASLMQETHVLPVPWVDSEDVSNAVLFLASDESRCMTGVALPVDVGLLINR
jgi:(+)-trans-carveol dehydrogenase